MATPRIQSRASAAGEPPILRARLDIGHHARLRRDLRAHADPQMAGYSDLSAGHHEVGQFRRPGNPDLADDHAMAADHHIMGDLHEIIDLGSLTDDGVAIGAAIDCGVGPDLDIVLDDDPADLRHFLMTARTHGEAESVLADAHAWMNDHPVADQRGHHARPGADDAHPADAHVGADHRIGSDHRASADFRARPDDRAGIDGHAGLEPGQWVDIGARRDAMGVEQRKRPRSVGIELCGDNGAGAVGIARQQPRDMRGNAILVALTHEAGRGFGSGQLVHIFGIVEKDEVARPRLIERRDAENLLAEVRAFVRRGAGPCDNIRQRGRHRPTEEGHLVHRSGSRLIWFIRCLRSRYEKGAASGRALGIPTFWIRTARRR